MQTTGMTLENYRWAEQLVEARDPLGALKLIEPVLDDERDNVAVQLLAARAYFGSAQLGRAEATLRRVIELDPRDAWALHALGRTLERAGRGSEAGPYFRLAAAMCPEPEYVTAAWRYTPSPEGTD
ncbi:tetratricopeptide repeat protein [Yinghuangia seranimata]|uniref:tetratricopeptide repeat protein n=1 Tax=Yinghuangia seranimata TaxID=408067 RepID=UPI00248AFC2B|nr:tetratricopeptide repeat protein [Yinghuangia seranimata]MDI2132628.1 tetratricopeptide repeat protein [Yinghuangia seranimata]